ncbi:MAG TPA: histidine phosphatase family protein, partial [Chlamydiales bacterium]
MSSNLILMRHGASVWNQQNLFTGWVDVPLSAKGIQECIAGGKKIQNEPIDVIFTSALLRAQMTVALALLDHASGKVPVFQHPGKAWSEIHSEETLKKTIPVYIAQ